ncbi:MAG: transposase [Planctomycetia bacterium]
MTFALRQAKSGLAVEDVCRKLGIYQATFFRCKTKYGAMGNEEIRRLRILKEKNRKLKQLVADLSLDKKLLQDVVSKKL